MTVPAIHANDRDSTDNWCVPNCILLYQRVFEILRALKMAQDVGRGTRHTQSYTH